MLVTVPEKVSVRSAEAPLSEEFWSVVPAECIDMLRKLSHAVKAPISTLRAQVELIETLIRLSQLLKEYFPIREISPEITTRLIDFRTSFHGVSAEYPSQFFIAPLPNMVMVPSSLSTALSPVPTLLESYSASTDAEAGTTGIRKTKKHSVTKQEIRRFFIQYPSKLKIQSIAYFITSVWQPYPVNKPFCPNRY